MHERQLPSSHPILKPPLPFLPFFHKLLLPLALLAIPQKGQAHSPLSGSLPCLSLRPEGSSLGPQSATQSSVLGRLARIYPAPALQAFLFSLLLAFLLYGASAVSLTWLQLPTESSALNRLSLATLSKVVSLVTVGCPPLFSW